jgi:pyruvate-ferredoxin/flavodoxin oxidoreductase
MTERKMVTLDGNEAAAYVAHAVNEVIAIYPITPSSPMGEWADQWTSERRPNIWARCRTSKRCRARPAPRAHTTEPYRPVLSERLLRHHRACFL